MGAPGVTFELVDPGRPRVQRLRTDICGFLGYAERGPLDRPVKLRSWRQFLDAFGPPLDYAHTGHGLRLFFENGGDACHMLRVADPDEARAASLSLDIGGVAGALRIEASFSAIGRTRDQGAGPTGAPASAPLPNPGRWGNRLAVRLLSGGLGVTRSLPSQPPDGASLRVETLAGFVPGSWVRLIQDGEVRPRHGRVAALDPALREIVWQEPLAGLDFQRRIRLETVEFTLVVLLDDQEVARHADLSLDPAHPRFVAEVLANESALVAAQVTLDPAELVRPEAWPAPGPALSLAGGQDGLATVAKADWLAALALLEAVDEIGVLAAPDLVLRASDDVEPLAPPLSVDVCGAAEPPPPGRLTGVVTDAETGGPVRGVRATSREVLAPPAMTDGQGRFTLTGLPPGQAAIRLERDGYIAADVSGQAFASPGPFPQRFVLARPTLPKALSLDEVWEVQEAMAAQGRRARRVALLDVPEEAATPIEALQGWRMRFDTSHAALYWPWLLASPDRTGARLLPPSGPVAGLVARMDLAEGPHRPPANRPLRGVAALSQAVDDATHGLLNEQGINVLRAFPGRGIAPQGARTLSSDPEWRFLNVRRLVLMIAEAVEESHQWAVFEPNDRVLRDALTHSLGSFLAALWRRGAFAGASPAEAFAVKCDEENNPPAVVDAGQVVAEIGIAPVRPYEFIRLRLGRTDRLRVQTEEGS